MIDEKLLEYIRQHLALGESKETILISLQHRIWSDADIEENFTIAMQAKPVTSVVTETTLHQTQAPTIQPTTSTPVISTSVEAVTIPQIGQTVVAPTIQTTEISKKTKMGLVGLLAGLFLTTAVGFAAYGYVEKIGPFSNAPYDETNLLGGVLASFDTIKTSTYTITASVKVGEREAGRKPFVPTEDEVFKEKYKHDFKRATRVRFIFMQLQSYAYASKGQYPSSLADLDTYTKDVYSKNTYNNQYQLNSYLKNNYLRDPVTNEYYTYSVNQDRTAFTLKIVFETSEVVNLISQSTKSYAYAYNSSQTIEPTTVIDKKTVTFTKGSNSYFYISEQLPKPFLVTLSDMTSQAPPELAISTSIKATTDITEEKDLEWNFNFDAVGDFGDLTYKLGADAIKKNNLYYFRINNIPGVFGTTLSALKSKWIKIDPKNTEANNQYRYSDLSFLTSSIPEAEKKYKENKADTQDFLKKVVGFADEEKVIVLKNRPVKVSLDGDSVYKYEVSMNKENIVPFYKKMLEEAQSNKTISSSDLFNDSVTVEYLESKQFEEMFNYINSTVDLVLYINQKGLLQGVDYVMHIIPPDTAVALKDKQINISLLLRLQDINKPVYILAPVTSTTIEDIASEYRSQYYGGANIQNPGATSGDAKKIAELKAMQLALDQYAEANQGAYPTKLTALSPTYMPMLPSDPNYKYAALGKGKCTAYHLGIVLESTSSPVLANDRDATSTLECAGSAKDFSGADPMFDVKGEQ